MEQPSRNILEHLADAELENEQIRKGQIQAKGCLGEYTASGEGAIFGPVLNGIVSWTLYQEASHGANGFNLLGVITTDDRAQIRFDVLGYMVREDGVSLTNWSLTGSVRFETDSGRHHWMNSVVGVWQGTYDMGAFRHSYRIFVHRSSA